MEWSTYHKGMSKLVRGFEMTDHLVDGFTQATRLSMPCIDQFVVDEAFWLQIARLAEMEVDVYDCVRKPACTNPKTDIAHVFDHIVCELHR